MALLFTSDPEKAASNLRRHGVSFEDAATAFGDPHSITIPDPDHSRSELRFILLGTSRQGSPCDHLAHRARRDDSNHQRSPGDSNRAPNL